MDAKTTTQTITCDQITALMCEAGEAGDDQTHADCRAVIDSLLYLGSDDPEDVRGEVKDALKRIVEEVAAAEASAAE